MPETGFDPKHSSKEVAWIIVPGNEGITLQLFNGQRYQMGETDILPNHDSEVLDRKIAERFSSESMASGDKVGGKRRLSPIFPFKLLKCFVSLLPTHFLRGVKRLRCHGFTPKLAVLI
ncbi:MAG TPA: hypothetical protein VF807_12870 [Ktedonobacterales bacterium]